MARPPTIADSHYGLELEGVSVGRIASFSGGDVAADVVVEQVGQDGQDGQDGVARKHLGDVKYEDIRVGCGTDMAATFYDWLQQTFGGTVIRKNGAVVTYDFNGHEVARLSFFNGLVTEISFPALDAASKDAAQLTIKITPEHTRDDPVNSTPVLASPSSKKWLSSNFRLTIDGASYTKVNAVAAMTVRRSVEPGTKGVVSDHPTPVVVSDLAITLADLSSDATALRNWFNSFVIAGINGQEQEKSGTLEYLTSDLKTSLFTLDLRQLGVYRLSRLHDSGETISRIQARMYCEQIVFSYASNQTQAPTLTLVPPLLPVENISLPPPSPDAGSSAPGQSLPSIPPPPSRAPRNLTPVQGPPNLPPQQQQQPVPSPQPRLSLAFRNLPQ